jgi:IS30 family transposase
MFYRERVAFDRRSDAGSKLDRALASVVADKLRLLWSPEQIAGWLKHRYPCDDSRYVSHETIYRSLFIQARGALVKELLEHLRCTRGMRRSRQYTQKTAIHGKIADAVSISERPASAEDRAVRGTLKGTSSAAGTVRSPPWWSAKPGM